MKRTTLTLTLALLPLAASCTDDLGLGSEALPVIGGNGDECPKLGCSSNSAYLGPTEFHELDETGATANAEGLRITSFTKNGAAYRADVTGTVLVGKQYILGFGWINALTGQGLVGAEFAVDGPTARYAIKITSASTVQKFWQGPAGLVNTYELQWRQTYPAVTHAVPVCKDPPNRIDGEGKEWDSITEAILFTGDRYNTDTLTVTASSPRGAGNWFNIGCAGTVIAKLALNRHTDATQTAAMPTTQAQRQAMLKMYTSDVCNTGEAFTVQGTPIRWVSTGGWSSPAIPVASSEAHWNESGATCLDVHRLHGSFNDMDSQIAASCAAAGKVLLPCAGDQSPFYLRTYSPATP